MDRFDTYISSYSDSSNYSGVTSSQGNSGRTSVSPFSKGSGVSSYTSAPATKSSNLILCSLSVAHYAKLRPFLRTVFLEADSYLYFQGEELEYVYFPDTAVISDFRTLEDGRMVEVALTGRDGAVGLSALLYSTEVTNCMQVSQAGSAVRVEARELRKLLTANPEMSKIFSSHVAQYVGHLSQRAICNMFHSANERLCTWLRLMQDQCKKTTMKLTQEQMARVLGVYRPTVTGLALEMKNSGLINYARGSISIGDRDKMELAACDCYSQLAGAF